MTFMTAFIALSLSIFGLYGMFQTSYGVDSTAIMAFFHISESQQGLILTSMGISGVIVTIVLGLYGEKLNKIHGILVGCALIAFPALLISLIPQFFPEGSGYAIIVLATVAGGLGCGIIDLLMSGMVSDVFPETKQSLLPLVQGSFSAGAMLITAIIPLMTDPYSPESYAKPFFIIGIFMVIVGILFLIVSHRIIPNSPYADMSEIRKRVSENPAEIFKEKAALAFFLASFCVMGFQNSISMWITEYCQHSNGLCYADAARIVTIFWTGILCSRLACPLWYKIFSVRRFYILFNLLSAVFYAVFLFADLSLVARYAIIGLLGFCIGGSAPSLILLCCNRFPTRSASAASLFVLGVNAASLLLPIIIGNMIDFAGYETPMIMLGVLLLVSTGIIAGGAANG